MSGKLSLPDGSQRFQVIALLFAIVVILTGVIGVSALSSAGGAGGIAISGGEDADEPGLLEFLTGEGDAPGIPGSGDGSDGDTDGDGEDGSDGETDPGDEPSDSDDRFQDGDGIGTGDEDGDWGGEDIMPHMLNATETALTLGSERDTSPLDEQASPDSFVSLNPEAHFSTDNAPDDSDDYWRVTTYDTYEDGVWEDTDNELESLTEGDETGDSESYTVTFHEETSHIPATGVVEDVRVLSGVDPETVEFKQESDGTIVVTDGDGNIDSLPDNAEIEITARDDATVDEGPVNENVYTAPATDLPSEVGDQAETVTDDADADTNEEKAEAITNWVRDEHEYRVDANASDEEDPVEHFLFDSQAGGSEEFATTTAVMLREEGVPARVATGYRLPSGAEPGQDDDELPAGSMKQHMWVEAQNEDGEWVTYEPTPTQHDTQAEYTTRVGDEQALEYGVDESILGTWEQRSSPAIDEDDSDFRDSIEELLEEEGYIVELAPEPVPGGDVTVTVYTPDDRTASGVDVYFNDEHIGTTSSSGELETTVPYTETLRVTVDDGVVGSLVVADEAGNNSENGGSASTGTDDYEDTGDARGGFTSSDSDSETSDRDNNDNGSDNDDGASGDGSYDLPTDVTIEPVGVTMAGESVDVTADIDGTPVQQGDVTVNGEYVGETDENGEITVTIPEDVDPGDSVTVTVTRDEIEDDDTVTVATPELEVDAGLIALPGTEATVSMYAAYDDERVPLENENVSIAQYSGDGVVSEEGIELDGDGEATIMLPWANDVTVEATVHNVHTDTSITGMYYNAVGVGLGVLSLLIGGFVLVSRRYEITTDRIISVFYTIVFTGGELLLRFFTWIGHYARNAGTVSKRLVRRIYRWLRSLNILGRLISVILKPTVLVAIVHRHALRFWRALKALYPGRNAHGSESRNPSDVEGLAGSLGTTGHDLSARERIRQCWRWLVRYAFSRHTVKTKTTVEIEEDIVAAGVPKRYVERVREAFQAVQYGFRDGEERIASVEEAVGEIKGEDDTNTEQTTHSSG